MRLVSLFSILLILWGCSGGRDESRHAIAVSFEPQAWLLRQIAGDEFDIVTLLPPGSDPESYQPTISTMKGLGNSDAFFTLGTIGFEKSLSDNVSANFPELKIIDCSAGIEKITDTHHHSGNHEHGDESFDPHLLTSFRNCIAIARNMTNTLSEIYPEKAEKFQKAADTLAAKLQQMDDSVAGMNLQGKAILIKHPSLSYFSRDYGLTQIAMQTDGKESSPHQLKRRLEEVGNVAPRIYVAEKETTSQSDIETARQMGMEIVDVSLNSASWLDDLIRISNEIDRD